MCADRNARARIGVERHPGVTVARGGLSADHVQRGVADDEPYQLSADQPWRRTMEFLPCTATPIRPLLEQLEFIVDPQRWGYKFRFGVFRIDQHDFELIRSAMTRPLAA